MARPRKPRATRAPSRLAVRKSADGVDISWAWYAPYTWVALGLYAVGLGLAWVGLGAVQQGQVAAEWRQPVVGLLVAGVVFFTWVVAALVVNRTTIRVTAEAVTVAHGPLYWPGGRRFRAADVTDVSVAEFVDSTGEGDPVVTYRLYVYTRSSYPRTLVAGIEDKQEAERIAGLVRVCLGRVAEQGE